MSAILVPRNVVRQSAEVLSHFPAWKKKPCASLKTLIYGLNTIHGMYPGFRYDTGLPQPSVPARQLMRLATICRQVARTGNMALLHARLAVLKRQNTGSFALLAFQAALAMGHRHPTGATLDPEVIAHLEAASPDTIAAYAVRAAERLDLVVSRGRGGTHNKAPVSEYALVQEIGLLFESITGRPPGVTYRSSGVGAGYGGPAVEFAQIVYESLGVTISGRQLMRRLGALDVPEWRRPQNRVAWRAPSKKSPQSPRK
jgi:hypothetical protein